MIPFELVLSDTLSKADFRRHPKGIIGIELGAVVGSGLSVQSLGNDESAENLVATILLFDRDTEVKRGKIVSVCGGLFEGFIVDACFCV